MKNANQTVPIYLDKGWLYKFMVAITLTIIIVSVLVDSVLPIALIPCILLAYITIKSPKVFYYILFLSVPFAVEVYLPNGFATDLPIEPLAIIGTGIFLLLLLINRGKILPGVWTHPLIVLVLIQLVWILFTVFFAEVKFIALKYFLAKIWFTGAFLFLSLYCLKQEKDIELLFKILFYALIPAMLFTFIRHAQTGFEFKDVNRFMYPFFRNKVFFSSILLCCFPIGIYLIRVSKSKLHIFFIFSILCLFLAGMLSAYTRAPLALLISLPLIPIILKLRLIKPLILVSLIGICYFVYNVSSDRKFVDYAPNFETTISHKSFGNLLEATAEGRDVSTMERVYRWVAGYYMVQDRPLVGFGPNNFYSNYKSYTLNIFRTYVSDNKEKSGIHSYYLMVAVEQGIPGLLLLLAIIIFFFIRAERLYSLLPSGKAKCELLAVIQIFLIFTVLQTINDMVEAYKVGIFYFLCIAILVRLETNFRSSNIDHQTKNLE